MCTSGVSPVTTGQVPIWRSSGRGQAHRGKEGRKSLFPQCKTSSGHNHGSITLH